MANIVKPIHIQIVQNSDGSGLISELGTWAFVIQTGDISTTNNTWNDTPNGIKSLYQAVNIDDELTGNLVFDGSEVNVTRLQVVSPLTLSITLGEIDGYIKLLSSNGYYAVSSVKIQTAKTVSLWNLYTNENVLVGSASPTTWGFPFEGRDTIVNLISNISDGTLTGNYINAYKLLPFSATSYRLTRTATNVSSGSNLTVLNWINGLSAEPFPSDPYSGAGDSGTGGGDGTFDGTSDPVPIPSLPRIGATDSGFITLFAPTVSQLKDLAHYMWINPLFDVEAGFKKLFSDPMDCILGLSVVPVAIPTGGAQNVNIGNLVTSVSMNVASQQYIEVDCGSIKFAKKFFGSYLDYEPYTKMSIFVPYSGVHSLCADDIMGKTVQLVYHIDILTGSLVAFLKCGDSVLYEFNGACGSNIPVNSLNYASTIENAIRIAVNIGTTVATAGAAAPAAMGAEAVGGAMTARNIATGINIAGSTAEGALSLKPNIDRAGSLGGTTGLLGNQTPYIIITRPRLCKPKDQNKIKGYPSFITCTLGDLDGKGYTEIDTVILNNIYLTDAEKDELIGVLKGGVYL